MWKIVHLENKYSRIKRCGENMFVTYILKVKYREEEKEKRGKWGHFLQFFTNWANNNKYETENSLTHYFHYIHCIHSKLNIQIDILMIIKIKICLYINIVIIDMVLTILRAFFNYIEDNNIKFFRGLSCNEYIFIGY